MSDRMRWLGQCDAKGCFIEQRWHLTELDGTLPRGANFGDLDAWAEIDGRFLFIEHKPEGFSWKQDDGQWRALKRLNALPGVTVWWMRDCGDSYEIAEPGDQLEKISKTQLREQIIAWAAQADRLCTAGRVTSRSTSRNANRTTPAITELSEAVAVVARKTGLEGRG